MDLLEVLALPEGLHYKDSDLARKQLRHVLVPRIDLWEFDDKTLAQVTEMLERELRSAPLLYSFPIPVEDVKVGIDDDGQNTDQYLLLYIMRPENDVEYVKRLISVRKRILNNAKRRQKRS